MILFEITGTEEHKEYQALEVSNGARQYGFLRSVVLAATKLEKPFLSQQIIKALNFHAITCLHTNAGEYRPCEVTVGEYKPPEHFRISALMDDFTNTVNHGLAKNDSVVLAVYVLWRLNHIHPFINGNGRTARAACYFVLCVKEGGWLPGEIILPELLRQNRDEYVKALQSVDQSVRDGKLDLSSLHDLVTRLLNKQLGIEEG